MRGLIDYILVRKTKLVLMFLSHQVSYIVALSLILAFEAPMQAIEIIFK